MSDVVLSVHGLYAAYSDEDVLKGIDVVVERHSIVAIIGPNGSGKSTLLKTIYGLLPTRSGEVTLFDEENRAHRLTGMKPESITALGLNMVPQLANVFPEMSVLENLEIGGLPIRHRFAEQAIRFWRRSPSWLQNSESALPLYPAASVKCWRSRAR